MTRLREERLEANHLNAKLDKVKDAYRAFAHNRERWSTGGAAGPDVFLSRPLQEERGLEAHLLNQSELAALLREAREADAKVSATKQKLATLGFPDV